MFPDVKMQCTAVESAAYTADKNTIEMVNTSFNFQVLVTVLSE